MIWARVTETERMPELIGVGLGTGKLTFQYLLQLFFSWLTINECEFHHVVAFHVWLDSLSQIRIISVVLQIEEPAGRTQELATLHCVSYPLVFGQDACSIQVEDLLILVAEHAENEGHSRLLFFSQLFWVHHCDVE